METLNMRRFAPFAAFTVADLGKTGYYGSAGATPNGTATSGARSITQ
jgi:hypothetical protein